MVDLTILAMTEDEGWLLSLWSDVRRLKKTRVVAARSMDEANNLLDWAGAGLLVLDCQASSFSVDDLDHLLWANSTRAHPALVLAIDRTYQPDLAVQLFQLGVDEYVCSSEHGGQLAAIARQLLDSARDRETEVVPAAIALVRRPAPLLPVPARLVAAAMA